MERKGILKTSASSTNFATTGLGKRLDPASDQWFDARIDDAGTADGHNVYDLVEVEPDLTGFGYTDKPGGLTVEDAWEVNDTPLSVGAIVRARFRAWGLDGEPTYEIVAAGGGGEAGAVAVDTVHVVGVFVNQGVRLYTVRRVDRRSTTPDDPDAPFYLKESSPVVQYTGVYESQNRNAVIDDPGVPTHAIPLWLDTSGAYFIQIDQYADGPSSPGEGIAYDSMGGYEDLIFPGIISGDDQVMGDGVKTFRRAVVVNASRNADGDTLGETDTVPAFRVKTDAGGVAEYGLTVYAAAPAFPFLGGVIGGAAVGPRVAAERTSSFPLTVDGTVFGDNITYWRGGTHYGYRDHVGGGFTYVVPRNYTLSATLRPVDPNDPASFLIPGPTEFNFTHPDVFGAAYSITASDRYYRGVAWSGTMARPGGGYFTLYFYGGILYRVEDENGVVAGGTPAASPNQGLGELPPGSGGLAEPPTTPGEVPRRPEELTGEADKGDGFFDETDGEE